MMRGKKSGFTGPIQSRRHHGQGAVDGQIFPRFQTHPTCDHLGAGRIFHLANGRFQSRVSINQRLIIF